MLRSKYTMIRDTPSTYRFFKLTAGHKLVCRLYRGLKPGYYFPGEEEGVRPKAKFRRKLIPGEFFYFSSVIFLAQSSHQFVKI